MKKPQILAIILFISAPFFALAVNDVSFTADTDFEIDTSDTAVLTTITASSGGLVTNLDIELNYIDITLDNLSAVTWNVATASRYFKITKQSGSNDYTVGPTCPTTSAILTGTGAQVVLRIQIQTTNPCGGGGGGGSSGSVPSVVTTTTTTTTIITPVIFPTDCRPGDLFSSSTGQACPVSPPGCTDFTKYSPLTGQLCPVMQNPPSTLQSPSLNPPLSFYFTRNLTVGQVGVDVRALQIYLNNHGFTVSTTGPGSRGQESTYFGLKTKAALIRFQEAHRAAILTPLNLIFGTGYFGLSTRTYVNAHL